MKDHSKIINYCQNIYICYSILGNVIFLELWQPYFVGKINYSIVIFFQSKMNIEKSLYASVHYLCEVYDDLL